MIHQWISKKWKKLCRLFQIRIRKYQLKNQIPSDWQGEETEAGASIEESWSWAPEPAGRGGGLWLVPGQKADILSRPSVPSITGSIRVLKVLTVLGVNVMVDLVFQERSERWLLVVVWDDHFQSTMTIFSRLIHLLKRQSSVVRFTKVGCSLECGGVLIVCVIFSFW